MRTLKRRRTTPIGFESLERKALLYGGIAGSIDLPIEIAEIRAHSDVSSRSAEIARLDQQAGAF